MEREDGCLGGVWENMKKSKGGESEGSDLELGVPKNACEIASDLELPPISTSY